MTILEVIFLIVFCAALLTVAVKSAKRGPPKDYQSLRELRIARENNCSVEEPRRIISLQKREETSMESFRVVFNGDEVIEAEVDCDPVSWTVGVLELAESFPPEVLILTGEQLIKLGGPSWNRE